MTGQDPRSVDPELSARFPGWDIKRGTDGHLHARLAGTDPPLVASGEDETDLRDQIRAIALRSFL